MAMRDEVQLFFGWRSQHLKESQGVGRESKELREDNAMEHDDKKQHKIQRAPSKDRIVTALLLTKRWRGQQERQVILLRLVHATNNGVDSLAAVTGVAALSVVGELLALEATVGVRKLEGPEEVGDSLEVGAAGGDLVNNVLDREDAVLAEVLLDDLVVVDGETLAVDLGVTTLVDEVTDGLEVGGTVGDVGLNKLEHLRGGLGQADKDTVVDLEKTEELQNLAGLGGDVVDTTETDNKDNFRLAGNVEVTLGLGGTAETDLLTLSSAVLLGVLLGTLEDHLALGEVGLECDATWTRA